MRTTVVSWNLKGSERPDTETIASHLREAGADVVALQEVQWHQARRIARGLGATSWRWSFKHWPGRTWPEGMAVVGVHRRVRVRARALSHVWRLWSWRRRIVQVAEVEGGAGAGSGGAFTLVNVHLTPHGEIELRTVETATVLGVVAGRRGPVVVTGDFNERPDGPVHRQLSAAGLRDATGAVGDAEAAPPADPAPTNWRGWRRGTTEPPSQRLDYVYASDDVGVVSVRVPRPGDAGFERFPAVSDHLPVTAVLEVDGAGRAGEAGGASGVG